MLPSRSTSISTDVDVEQIIRERTGDVLMKQTLLKADHFPGCQNMKLTPLIDGAPNFRKVESLPVYGVAIPTVTGLRNVLDHLGAQNGNRKVYWHNMREEPVIYVNGQPYVVREADQPFCNLEYTGIDRTRVEDMENRLKKDILAEAERFGRQVLVANENDEMQVVEAWEPVTQADVQTPLDVYEELKADGYDIDYLRVPVTDEKAPKDSDFELLIQRLWRIPSEDAIIFNCQMGRGRTTTGMIIASLVLLRRSTAFPRSLTSPSDPPPPWFPTADPTHQLLPSTLAQSDGIAPAKDPLQMGQYGVIRSLLRVLEQGVEGKVVLDAVVDACSAMQNLREAIASYRSRILGESTERKRNMLMGVCLEYLERYYMLIVFSTFLCSPHPPNTASFTDWTNSRPELRSILSRMLRRNALSALELHQHVSEKHDTDADGEDGASLILDGRAGLVLGPNTILKQDHFPGMRSIKIPQLIEGAPNFRRLEGMPVYGVAISTVEGIRGVLRHIQEAEGREGRTEPVQVLWFNMREEPEVYLNGQPYVLREGGRPLKNLMEYAGIDAPRLELMEDRLRADIWAEAAQCGGRVLVTREALSGGQQGVLQDGWEPLGGPHTVQTPAMVYQQLQAQGVSVHYCRVPVTDGTSPSAVDIDCILQQLLAAGLTTPVVFNCQMGIGRTTTGMTIAGLLHLAHRVGPSPRLLASNASNDSLISLAAGMGSTSMPPTWSFPLTDAMHSSTSPSTPGPTPSHPSFSTSRLSSRSSLPPLNPPLTPPHPSAPPTQPPASPAVGLPIPIPSPFSRAALASSPRPLPAIRAPSPPPYLSGAPPSPMSQHPSMPYSDNLLGSSPTADLYDLPTSASEQDEGPSSPEVGEEYTEEEVMEQQAMAAGAYVGVRRVARLLEGGDSAKKLVDFLLDCNSQLINLRVAIMRYCKPQHSYKYIRTEMNQRHANFSRGAAYLERYCLLIAFASFLDQNAGIATASPIPSFAAWIQSRPDLQQALSALHTNPGAALAPVPIATLPFIYQAGEGDEVDLDEQRIVLAKRRGRTLTKRTILKSYQVPRAPPSASLPQPAFIGLRQAEGLPIYTAGNIAVHMLRQLLEHLGAGPGGSSIVVISDVREELVTYVNGTPYIRRELEMPSAALHHAGIQAKQLERLESMMVGELRAEVAKWGGKLLLHREVPRRPSRTASGMPAGESPDPHHPEDITRVVDAEPGAAVVAFWEPVGTSPLAEPSDPPCPSTFPYGLFTAKEVIEQLQQEGLALTYRRIPLSRERTPEAGDVDALHAQLHAAASSSVGARRLAVHLVLSRTASGSSARFAAAALASSLRDGAAASAAGLVPSRRVRSAGAATGQRSGDLSSAAAAGEYRGIMSLCRVLPAGMECKAAVDAAIDSCRVIGNLRMDILDCALQSHTGGASASAAGGASSAAFAARHLGIHYLRRYFLLVAFRCYLNEVGCDGGAAQGGAEAEAFSEWMASRAELGHLMHHLSLET